MEGARPSLFETARERLKSSEMNVDEATRNRLYGLYKQATEGNCTQEPPSKQSTARPKWEAWSKYRGMSTQQAMDNYVAEVKALDRNWEPSTASPTAAGIPRSERKHGVLYKQRDVFKGWRPRIFVLEDAVLHYYLQEDNIQTSTPRKSLMLSGCTVTEVKVTTVGESEFYPFVVSHPQSSKTYNLASDNQQDAQEWIRAIREAASKPPPSLASDPVDPTARLVAKKVLPSDGPGYNVVDSSGRPAVPTELVPKVNSCVAALLEAANSDDEWQPMGVKNGIQTYKRPGTLVCVRGDGEIPFPITDVFALIIDLSRKKEYDTMWGSGKRVKKFSNRTWVDHIKYKQVWPTAPRDYVNVAHWRIVEDGCVVVCAFSHKLPDIPPEEGTVRAECILGGWVLRPLNGGRSVRASYVVQTDLKGSIPTTVVNMVTSSQPMLVLALRKALEEHQHNQRRFLLPQRMRVNETDLDLVVDQLDDPTARTTNSAAEAAHEESKAQTPSAIAPKPEKEPLSEPVALASSAITNPRPIGLINLSVLFLPLVLYALVPPHLRGVAFLAGSLFALRYVFRMHLGAPRQHVRSIDTDNITEGRMLVKFPVDIAKLLRFLEEKRKNTEMEITLTHLAAKAAAIALAERSQMNGRVILGGFYPADDVDISVSVNMPRDESVLVKIAHAHKKPVEYIADELAKRVTALRAGQDPVLRRKLAILSALPPIVALGVDKFLQFLGSQLGLHITALGVQKFPLGSATIITAPAADGRSDADMDMTVIPTMYNASTPITITVGGIHVQPKLDSDKKLGVIHVLTITASIDCRAGTLQQGRAFCERLQQLLTNPALLDKFDRQQLMAIEKIEKESK